MGSQHFFGAMPTTESHPFESRPPREALAQLGADRRKAKAELRDVLERLAKRYAISQRDINYAMDGYADDMLSDLLYSVERDLEHADEQQSSAR